MEKQFYIGQVVEPEDLFFREEFISELWEKLKRQHVILTAPRRTGKTSVMTDLFKNPQDGWMVLYLNVQDTSTPSDFYLRFLDEFNTHNPDALARIFSQGESLIKTALGAVGSVEYATFKVALRDQDEHLAERWRDRLDDLLNKIRKTDLRVLVILDELPDMLIAMKKHDPALLRDFLGWFRDQRQKPTPADDNIRWLIGGSINLMATLDSMGLVDRMNDPEIVPLPIFSKPQVMEFVGTMLHERNCDFEDQIPEDVAEHLGRPVPYFMQVATQDLFRIWRQTKQPLTSQDVENVFNNMVTSPEARDKLQHYHSRIAHYYDEATAPAYALLDMISLSEVGISRKLLKQKYDELRQTAGEQLPLYDEKRSFNELMLHLENDFYIIETENDQYDFAGGVLKAWWRKYYA